MKWYTEDTSAGYTDDEEPLRHQECPLNAINCATAGMPTPLSLSCARSLRPAVLIWSFTHPFTPCFSWQSWLNWLIDDAELAWSR